MSRRKRPVSGFILFVNSNAFAAAIEKGHLERAAEFGYLSHACKGKAWRVEPHTWESKAEYYRAQKILGQQRFSTAHHLN